MSDDAARAATMLLEQRRELSVVLRGALPADRAARIESLVRDTIGITTRKAKKADAALGASRLGGCPDLPEGMAWPNKDQGDVDFVGQLRLEDLAPFDVHQRLPPRGLLSFFHGFLTNGEYGPEARVLYFADAPAGLVTVVPPGARRGRPRPTGVDFSARALLPPHSSRLVPLEGAGDPYPELYDTHYDLYEGDTTFHGLFGFDRPLEDAQGDTEEVLLRLDANDAPYDFVEAACAYFFIPRGDLAQHDYSRVRLYEGASI
jgi:uncharacterized protein YwqG